METSCLKLPISKVCNRIYQFFLLRSREKQIRVRNEETYCHVGPSLQAWFPANIFNIFQLIIKVRGLTVLSGRNEFVGLKFYFVEGVVRATNFKKQKNTLTLPRFFVSVRTSRGK